jgi:hypothetical protein
MVIYGKRLQIQKCMSIKSKLKICDGCGEMKHIWKSGGTGGFKYCKYCWSCQKATNSDSSQKPNDYKIPQVSSKRKKQDAEYLKLRERFLTENPICQVSVAGCMNGSTDVHHTYAGSNRDAFYLVQSTWKAACRNCHDWIHTHPSEARTLGWLK